MKLVVVGLVVGLLCAVGKGIGIRKRRTDIGEKSEITSRLI
jgi:hypothetical protein